MSIQKQPNTFKHLFRRIVKRYHQVWALVFFVGGIAIRIYASSMEGAAWEIIGEFGSFLAAVIAIPFIYDSLFKSEDRELFLDDLRELLDDRLSKQNVAPMPFFYDGGRLQVEEKVKLLEAASKEVYEIGLSLRAFLSYFESRPYSVFKLPVENLLKKGVNFKVVLLDPSTEIAKLYSSDRGEDKLIEEINRSIEGLKRLKAEFDAKGFPGKFEVFSSPHFPYCYCMLIDRTEPTGCLHVSHYLLGLKRADVPVIEIQKNLNPILFEKYVQYVENVSVDYQSIAP